MHGVHERQFMYLAPHLVWSKSFYLDQFKNWFGVIADAFHNRYGENGNLNFGPLA